ncbi:TIGR03752 family integrating conjugative element protein [Dickeya dianthicola]|uniref:TIGR03752 family integrating conjugative element protein n=1 Tax=Dickeya dianthicola TaxID=204039 RepID=UPI00063D4E7B|nr:TIGR03752 family integrating conjugative element protein [Dickeya dianthicola]MZG45146.1 TIGR03752 family integrating conjugative element protein [Dickeya dianthicola]
MQIKSNMLVKIIVPTVVVAGALIGVKSCQSTPVQNSGGQTTTTLGLSQEELKALGVAGDTPQDTLRTLIGSLNQVRGELSVLSKQNEELRKQNDQLTKRSTDVSGQVNEAVAGVQQSYDARQKQLQDEQIRLQSRFQELTDKLGNAMSNPGSHVTGGYPQSGQGQGDIPLGLGLDGMGSDAGGTTTQGADGMLWVTPRDQKPSDKTTTGVGGTLSAPQFPTSFLGDNELTRQKAAYEQQVKGYSGEKEKEQADPVYTLPENSTLIGSRAMTALLGRIPINGTVTDPYPFKVLIGKDNLTANGIELPDVEGAIVSGTASGDWTLSCVRGQVTSITFVFADGTVRTLPRADANGSSNAGNSGGNQNTSGGSASSGIGWISDEAGIPCISGERKSNASTYLPTLFALSAGTGAASALSQNQQTTQTNGYGGVTSSLTGDAGQAVLGKAVAGGLSETTDWVKQRYGQTFDAIYVPPGMRLAVHITRQLAIDYEQKGRKVRYDNFVLPADGAGQHGLD